MTVVGARAMQIATGLAVGIGGPIYLTTRFWEWIMADSSHQLWWVVGMFFLINILAMASITILSIIEGVGGVTPDSSGVLLDLGLMSFAMLAYSLFIVPGLVYLFVLPVDETGSYNLDRFLSFDTNDVPSPDPIEAIN